MNQYQYNIIKFAVYLLLHRWFFSLCFFYSRIPRGKHTIFSNHFFLGWYSWFLMLSFIQKFDLYIVFFSNFLGLWVWQCTSVMPSLWRPRQKDCCQFKASLGYKVTSRSLVISCLKKTKSITKLIIYEIRKNKMRLSGSQGKRHTLTPKTLSINRKTDTENTTKFKIVPLKGNLMRTKSQVTLLVKICLQTTCLTKAVYFHSQGTRVGKAWGAVHMQSTTPATNRGRDAWRWCFLKTMKRGRKLPVCKNTAG